MKNNLLILSLLCFILSCKESDKTTVDSTKVLDTEVIEVAKDLEQEKEITTAELKKKLTGKGYQIFDYVDEKTKDTILMQQYFIAFLKRGVVRNQNEEEANRLQTEHLAHLGKMYELGYADISGPFGDDGDIRGITIYNVPTLEMADSLANADPMVKAGRLEIEIHPWWAAKGFPLR
ncbi:YciI family protein [Psychroserpens sp. XS_ASV72]|uniref:YciI family protein n=1 Tax=Psychroserpens sp. XS_ASV72 TaxID=3241293 RepID=UPI0035164E45